MFWAAAVVRGYKEDKLWIGISNVGQEIIAIAKSDI
jgi:hypothetical protein